MALIHFTTFRFNLPRFIIFLQTRFFIGFGAAVVSFVLLIGPKPAEADLVYRLSGSDYLNAGEPRSQSTVTYSGLERLRIVHTQDSANRLFVDANFRRTIGNLVTSGTATAGEGVGPKSAGGGLIANDPLHLTLLTQPFSAALDLETLAELRTLRSDLPFTSASPMTGSTVTGRLRRGTPGTVAGFPVEVLEFEADGPVRGSLGTSDHAGLTGIVHLLGTACYRRVDGLMLSLRTTLSVSGKIGNGNGGAPVAIVYKRLIRAVGQAIARPRADSLPNVKPS